MTTKLTIALNRRVAAEGTVGKVGVVSVESAQMACVGNCRSFADGTARRRRTPILEWTFPTFANGAESRS
ncbi:hypothetical protein MSIMFB_00859 [Mycobacterium simulans]|uniref:Uncharacterized protein n=1 Tax=Mycobacterium simulans TaxID=627089 RepID=A0A7Z7IH80_9MYCO|nr:hypothetical protein [Mycobacterium simulans]SOJ53358.1 hypothetical protein MSIMFB_00859 [Mycobacterium simulans]SON58923.1 hypothetical protein MSIMFI_00404 [Mycobacterium simulans]